MDLSMANDSQTAAVAGALQHEERKKDREKVVRKAQKKKGFFKQNPPLLEDKRHEFAIPNGCWNMQMVFDRILVYQIPMEEGDGTAGTSILLPEQSATRAANEANRGVIVNAGAEALDGLKANGIDLGHTIYFLRNSPWHSQVDALGGHFFHAIILQTGDIIGSEELAAAMTTGEAKVECKETESDDGVIYREHHYTGKDGKSWHALKSTFIPDDF